MKPKKYRFWDRDHMGYDIAPVFRRTSLNGGIQSLIDDGYILMEYIGLEDKNGKEIYEQDIVKGGMYNGAYMLGKIIYHKNSFIAVPISKFGEGFSESFEHFEVIGNTFENQNLLEEPTI